MKLPEIWELDDYRVADKLFPGAVVFDIGANVGQFSQYCLDRGAKVVAVEPYEPNGMELLKIQGPFTAVAAAVGSKDGLCTVKTSETGDKSLGAYTVEDEGDTEMIGLKSLLMDYDYVDVMKVDIEGAEYQFLTKANLEDLRKISYLTLEFHVWTHKENNEGLGIRPEPMPKNAVNKLISKLERVFKVTVIGRKEAGGYLLCQR